MLFGGVKISVSVHAMAKVTRWPVKKRSRRLHKKMTKRLGPQFAMEPCALHTPWGIVVHPEIYAAMEPCALHTPWGIVVHPEIYAAMTRATKP